jgi:hypothetical protein
VGQIDIWILFEQPSAHVQVSFMVEVIVGGPFKQGRRRELEQPIVVCDSLQVPLIANVMNAGIVPLIFATDVRGAIARSVITDQDLEVSKGLRQ